MRITGIVYTRAMLESIEDKRTEERYELYGREIPRSLLEAIDRNRLLELKGEFGDETVDQPVEYERLVIETDEGAVDLEVYNRGLMIFQYEQNGELKRIHRVLNAVQDHFELI